MIAFFYLIRKQCKNSLRELLRSPGRLLPYLAAAALCALPFLDGGYPGAGVDPRLPRAVSIGVSAVLCAAMAAPARSSCLRGSPGPGAALFALPLPLPSILLYEMAARLRGWIFALAVSGCCALAAPRVFGGPPAVITAPAFCAILAALICGCAVALLLDGRGATGARWPGRAARWAFAVCFAVLPALLALVSFASRGFSTDALLDASSAGLYWYPLAGWAAGAVFSALAGDIAAALIYGGLLAVCAAVCLGLFLRLSAPHGVEWEEPPVRRAPPGGGGARRASLRGNGASAFFFRQIREASRRRRLLFFNSFTLALLGADAFLLAIGRVLLRPLGRADQAAPLLAACLLLNCYLLYFAGLSGGWADELKRPYAFLAPCGAFAKLFWCSLATALKPAVDGVAVFLLLGAATGARHGAALACALAYTATGLLYQAVLAASLRLTGRLPHRGVAAALHLSAAAAAASPGMLCGLAVARAGGGFGAALLCLAAWELFAALLLLFLCRGLLAAKER